MRNAILFCALFFVVCAASAQAKPAADQPGLPAAYVPSGKQMFKDYCAACHGADGKGHGPVSDLLKTPAPDLTTLAQRRHEGKFPYDYVSSILLFGPGYASHGSSDMPTWGALFQFLDKNNQAAVQQRIRNLCDYLVSLQQE